MRFLFCAGIFLGVVSLPARAQNPAPRGAAAAVTPFAAPYNATSPARGGRRVRPTPADRRNQLEARLREMMQGFGVSAPATQDAVIAYLSEEEAGRVAVREAAKRLLNGVRRDAPPERMRDLISGYQGALAAETKRRQQAQTALDAKIGFSVDTRLEAVLWLSGVLGEGGGALPMGALAARAGEDETPARDSKRDAARDAARRGQVIGVLENKTPGWIEVRSEGGQLERFWPAWNRQLEAFEPRTIAAMAQLTPGARVRVEWERIERRRIIASVVPERADDGPIENATRR